MVDFKKVIIFCLMVNDFFTWFIGNGNTRRTNKISSWFRTVSYNKSIGGSPTSKHILGLAVDIPYPSDWYSLSNAEKDTFFNNIRNKVMGLADEYNTHYGLFRYSAHIHIDFLARETNAEGDYRGTAYDSK